MTNLNGIIIFLTASLFILPINAASLHISCTKESGMNHESEEMALLYGINSDAQKCTTLKMKDIDKYESYSEVHSFSKEIAKELQSPDYCISFDDVVCPPVSHGPGVFKWGKDHALLDKMIKQSFIDGGSQKIKCYDLFNQKDLTDRSLLTDVLW